MYTYHMIVFHTIFRLSVSVDRFRNSDLEEYSNYSLLGPDYEALNSRRQLQSQGKNLVSKDGRLSEQYEYSETHLTTEGGGAEESANYYEATSSLRQSVCTADDNYSYLKY